MKASTGFAVAAALVTEITLANPLQARTEVYDFTQITATPELIWTPCYGDRNQDFQCALLQVPLDYTNKSAGTTNIAFIQKPSKNASAEDILVNSGGPGGSGVGMVLSTFEILEEKLGTTHNLIGFDPRGVNNSGPSISCFPTSPVQQNLFFDKSFTPVDGRNEYELAESFNNAGLFGEWCSIVHSVNGTARYANTPAVAQDMLHYIELRAEARGHNPADAKLGFYGISYGTILGSTYAALYPNRISRMILDGVGDLEDYYTSGWTRVLYDTDATVRDFFKSCFEAGPVLCPFHKNASSADAIEKRYLAIYDNLKKSPVSVASPEFGPVTVTWKDISSVFFALAYEPLVGWPALAQAFTEMEEGNFTSAAAADPETTLLITQPYDSREVRSQVTCFDMNGRYNLSTLDSYRKHVEHQNNMSFYGGPLTSGIVATVCREMHVFPPKSQIFDGKVNVNSTSAPILFVSTKLDPITPLRSAKKMSSLFPGSAVLAADWVGHTTYFTPKSCVDKYTQAYIKNLSMPPPDTMCKESVKPFALGAA
ncbi:TAP-like protein-domain-containing protein [Dendryphion nanum]|uniref:TAP-like protein-domain-containing protein n=1 Tax=Dendryphion nanum TaxID=256645 RepID=A0A9P9E0D8_9PLEO|nr:TAP-like protein-domain-containing protein [Dendryphion nanum]